MPSHIQARPTSCVGTGGVVNHDVGMRPPLTVEVPPGLLAMFNPDPSWVAWLDDLPRVVRELLHDWDLSVDGRARHGASAIVVPVRDVDGGRHVLKVGWPHEEAEHEHLALQALHGNGTVLLHRADPRRGALLLERLQADVSAESLPDREACELVARLYARLHVPSLPQLRSLASFVQRWTEGLAALPPSAPVPPRLVAHAITLGRSFVDDDATVGTMIHGDLHGGNVLAANREPWLVIDPKPVSGDPHYEVAPMLWNRWDEVTATGDVRSAIRRRFHTIVDIAGLEEERARDWVIVRQMHNVLWAIQDAERAGQRLSAEDREWITRSVAIAKAVQG